MTTVNVVEYVDGAIKALHAFLDDKFGNEGAEALFTKLAKENGFADEYVEEGLDDGIIEEGTYQLFIVHNCNTKVEADVKKDEDFDDFLQDACLTIHDLWTVAGGRVLDTHELQDLNTTLTPFFEGKR